MQFDKRHIGPMIADTGRLAVGALYSRPARNALIDVGRAVRHSAFEAADVFPSLPFDEVLRLLGRGTPPADVKMPPGDRLWGNTIGGLMPYYYLGAIAAVSRPKTIFEIGTYLGLSALTFALNTPETTRIVTVDLPEDYAEGDTDTLTKGDKNLVDRVSGNVGRALRGHPAAKRVKQVLCNSLELNVAAHAKSIDLALIDGGHSYELVRNDTEKVLPCLAKGGVIIWDDYRWNLPGVSRYVRELLKDRPLRRIAGSQYVIYSERLDR